MVLDLGLSRYHDRISLSWGRSSPLGTPLLCCFVGQSKDELITQMFGQTPITGEFACDCQFAQLFQERGADSPARCFLIENLNLSERDFGGDL